MLTMGVDVGMRFAKLCLVEDGRILASRCFEMDGNVKYSYRESLRDSTASVRESGISDGNIKRIIATGYGAPLVPKAHCLMSESKCIAAVAANTNFQVRTVIDAGGLFIKIHTIDEKGMEIRTITNEKCAAGSGKFLEVAADVMNLPMDEVAVMDLSQAEPFHITSSCAVFAESEVISQIGNGKAHHDVLAGVIRSLASKTASLLENSRGSDPVFITGGLSAVEPFVEMLKKISGRDIKLLPAGPRLASAFGAALIGEKMKAGWSPEIINRLTSRGGKG